MLGFHDARRIGACGPVAFAAGLGWLVAGLPACGAQDNSMAGATSGSASATGDASSTLAMTNATDTTPPPSTTTGTADESGDDAKFDLAPPVDLGVGSVCKVGNDMDAIGGCDQEAPPDSFEPDVQWEWWGEGVDIHSVVTPLVANLTDDNGDGEIDLCDIPDVVVLAGADVSDPPGHLYVLDGETGTTQLSIAGDLWPSTTPAVGDIDGDGLPEIVALAADSFLVAFEHDGSLAWKSEQTWSGAFGAVALADLDNDGTPEILAGHRVFDHLGALEWIADEPLLNYPTSTAADLDGDGDLELVLGNAAFHHDGSEAWVVAAQPGFPQVGNLDADPEPEVLLTNNSGITLIEHDGAVKYMNLTPTGDPVGGLNWVRPGTIHDFDGDGVAEFAVSSVNHFTVYENDASILWSAEVMDESGIAAGTAFDFLGDGDAEAMYADEELMFVFGGAGQPLLQIPRQSRTGTEYPTVADIDNDGSAEILVVSNECISNNCPGRTSPTVQAIRDVDDRWIQARRIWNQHTYHVTNVREDATIPQFEPPHWTKLNTFRTQAQIENGGLCVPAG